MPRRRSALVDEAMSVELSDAHAAFSHVARAWKAHLRHCSKAWLRDPDVLACVLQHACEADTCILEFEAASEQRFRRVEELVRKVVEWYPHRVLRSDAFLATFAMLVHKATLPMFREEVEGALAYLRGVVDASAMRIVDWTSVARNDRCRVMPSYAQPATDEAAEAWIEGGCTSSPEKLWGGGEE